MSVEEVQVLIVALCAIEILSPSQSLQELVDKANKIFQLWGAILLAGTARFGQCVCVF